MAEELSAPSHPLGWTFLGVGSLIWLYPAFHLTGQSPKVLNVADPTMRLSLVAVSATAIGIILNHCLVPADRMLRKGAGLKSPPPEKWAESWQYRWREEPCNAEFNRQEWLISFGLAYAVHFLIGTILWARVALIDGGLWQVIRVTLIGLFLIGACWHVWYRNTKRLFTLVNSAAKWRQEGAEQSLHSVPDSIHGYREENP